MLLLFLIACGCARPPGSAEVPRLRPVPLDPSTRYTLRLWEFRYPVGPVLPFEEGGERHLEKLMATLAAFRQAFPNVSVEVTLLDFCEGDRQLAQALDAGDPPDVFASWWDWPLPAHELVVPVAPYLHADEHALYYPAAWGPASRQGEPVAWPRWLCPLVVAGRREVLAEVGLDVSVLWSEGWDWNDLLEAAVQACRPGARRGLHYGLVAPGGEAVLRWLVGSQGADLFTRGPELERALDWVRSAVDAGAMPTGPAADDRAVAAFVAGEAAFLLGAGPALACHLAGMPEVVLLPVPGFPGLPEVRPVAVTQLVVFRQRRFKGLEHTQAAMELARWLSRSPELFPRGSVLGVPAFQPDPSPEVRPALDALTGPATWCPGQGYSPERYRALQAARPLLAGWWAGRLSDGELVELLGQLLPDFPER